MLKAGQPIDRYDLVCPVGEGGMAEVWAARQRGAHGFEKIVALKIIHSRMSEDPTFRAMFLDEARIVAAIEHANVARVYDLGETNGLLYLVMEYVDGDALSALLATGGPVPLGVALRITAEACAGLHAVHALVDATGRRRNVVHRDVSPQNILLASNGDVKIIDFGIAHARDRSAAATAVGSVKGKVRYMAPEQARREEAGPWTDVFGAGATLYRMLAGNAPYHADNDVATMQALLQSQPPLVALPPSVPAPVAAVVLRAIAQDPRQRFATARDFQDAIEQTLAQTGERVDLAAWVNANVTEATRARRVTLAALAPGGTASAQPATRPDRRAGPIPAPAGMPGAPPVTAHFASLGTDLPARELVRETKPFPAPAPPGAPAPAPAVPALAAASPAPAPAFMDVNALVANARRVPDLPVAAPPQPAPPRPPEAAAPAPKIELAVQPRWAQEAPPKPSRRPLAYAILAIASVVGLVTLLLLMPLIVENRAVAAAHEAGLEIKVDHSGFGLRDSTLRGVHVKVIHTPGVTATIDELHLVGVTGRDIRIVGLDARIDGARADIEVGLAMLVSQDRAKFAGTVSSPRHLAVTNGHVTWTGIAGAGTKLELVDVGVDVESRGNGVEDTKGSLGKITFEGDHLHVGPWASSFETAPTSGRIRFAFDPPVPDGPSALVVTTNDLPVEVTMKIPRAPFANMGIKPEELGLPADAATELEGKLSAKVAADGKLQITGGGAMYGIHVKDLPKPIDVRLDGGASGTAGKPLDIDRTTIAFGPFIAAVTGTVTPYDKGLRVDALFKTLPLPCDKLARLEAKTMGSLAAALQAIGQSSGALRVTGVVNASGVVKYDSAAPDETAVTWVAKEACGVSILGM